MLEEAGKQLVLTYGLAGIVILGLAYVVSQLWSAYKEKVKEIAGYLERTVIAIEQQTKATDIDAEGQQYDCHHQAAREYDIHQSGYHDGFLSGFRA